MSNLLAYYKYKKAIKDLVKTDKQIAKEERAAARQNLRAWREGARGRKQALLDSTFQVMAKANQRSKKKLTTRKRRKIKRKFRTRRRGPGGQTINVKDDKDGYSRTYYKQKVTKQQQKKINKRFKGSFSPFKDVFENGYQETIPQATGKCKWIWRCYNNLQYLARAFEYWPDPTASPGSTSTNVQTEKYMNSEQQAVYFNKFKHTYEIYNPTNYDMNLVIYDIVCKQDTVGSVSNTAYNNWDAIYDTTHSDPIRLISYGLSGKLGKYPGSGNASVTLVSDPNAKQMYDITLKPTESYPFNIYWNIVRKHTYKLQPGSILHHKFVHKPKALFTRGYYAYKYCDDTYLDKSKFKGIKDITSGCLFKFWGQVTGTGDSDGLQTGTGYENLTQDHGAVTTLSGRLIFKEYIDNRWYCMDPKYSYTFKNNINNYVPADEEDLEVITESFITKGNDLDIAVDNPQN